jgi:hypothetical protein
VDLHRPGRQHSQRDQCRHDEAAGRSFPCSGAQSFFHGQTVAVDSAVFVSGKGCGADERDDKILQLLPGNAAGRKSWCGMKYLLEYRIGQIEQWLHQHAAATKKITARHKGRSFPSATKSAASINSVCG